MMKGSDIGEQEKKIAQPVINMGRDRQIQNVGGNCENQFRQYVGQVAQNQQGFNAWQNGGIQGARNAGVQSGGNQNRLVFVPGIANYSGTGNVVVARAEGTGIGNQARCYNCRGLGHIARICTARPMRRDVAYLRTQHPHLVLSMTGLPSMTQTAQLSMVHSGGTVERSSAPNEEIRTHQETIYHNLVDQVAQEELFLSNVSNMVTVSKMISIPNEDLSDDTTPSVARKFLNEVKSSLVTLQRVVKQKMTSIKSNRAHAKLHDLIFENSKLKARLFENTSESVKNTSGMSVTLHVDKPKLSAVTPRSKKLHALTQSHSVLQPSEFNVVRHRNVIAPEMFKINPSQTPRENVSSNMATASFTGLVHSARTRRPQPKGNTRNARVPSASKSSEVKKSVTVKDHRRTLLLSKN
nr:hypothetical protein [Tanacetum cinerariifolium]